MNYFDRQIDIIDPLQEQDQIMRTDVINLIMKFSFDNKFHFCTIHQAVILMDRYLSLDKISANDLDIVALSCLYLAVKIEEDHELISVSDLIKITGNRYNKEYFSKMENNILRVLNFQIYNDTVIEHLKALYANNKLHKENYCLSLYLSLLLLLTIDYASVDLLVLAKKIESFCLILSMPIKIIEELIINDTLYTHLYLLLQKSSKSDSCIIKKKFAIEKFLFVGLRSFPNVTNLRDYQVISIQDKYKKNTYSNNASYKSLIYTNPLNNIKHIKHIGSGTYGDVDHIKFLDKDFALKIVPVYNTDNTIDGFVLRELYSLIALDHPNIIKIKFFWYDYQKIKMYFGMELMRSTMHQKISNNFINEKTKALYIIQLLKGLTYIHSKNIMHRDIGTTNILISANNVVKISDFGSSRYFRHPNYSVSCNTNVCSLYFRAIEILVGREMYTSAIDVWSCACVIGFILRGRYLFVGINEHKLISSILQVLGTPEEIYKEELRDYSQYRRKGFVDLEETHPEQTKILYKMLEYEPNKRIDAATALDLFVKSYQHLLED